MNPATVQVDDQGEVQIPGWTGTTADGYYRKAFVSQIEVWVDPDEGRVYFEDRRGAILMMGTTVCLRHGSRIVASCWARTDLALMLGTLTTVGMGARRVTLDELIADHGGPLPTDEQRARARAILTALESGESSSES